MSDFRVVVTGTAPVTTIGTGNLNYLAARERRTLAVQPIPAYFQATAPFKSTHYIPLPTVDLDALGLASVFQKTQQAGDHMALAGIKLALDDAGIALTPLGGGRWAFEGSETTDLILGTGIASLRAAMKANLAHVYPDNRAIEALIGEKIRVDRMVIPMTMPSAAAAWASMAFSLGGAAFTLNASCASGTLAIGEAYWRIRSGASRRVITGGFEDLSDGFGGIMRGFDLLGALTRNADGDPRCFSADRSGFLFAEGGAGILVLEEREAALSRGARIYAEIVDSRTISEAHSIVQIDPSGQGIRRLLEPLVSAYPIDLVSPHATGTAANDSLEALSLGQLFEGRPQPVLQLSKGVLGHTIGASGALEAIDVVHSLFSGTSPGNRAERSFEGWNLNQESVSRPFEYGLSHSFGFGGHNSAVVFRRP